MAVVLSEAVAAAPPPDPASTPRISPNCPEETARILRAAAAHDVAALKKLLDVSGKASAQDPVTRETPLHAAVRAAAEKKSHQQGAGVDDDGGVLEGAKATIAELFWSGAIWNDVDDADETPGCVAFRLGLQDLYVMCRDAGVRAEMLFSLMEGYEELSSGGSEDGMEGDDTNGVGELAEGQDGLENGAATTLEDADAAPTLIDADAERQQQEANTAAFAAELGIDLDDAVDATVVVESETYLRSRLTYSDGKLVDEAGNGVMMAWETDIMRRSVDALLGPPGGDTRAGKRILNIGFGMGIIDSMFAETSPSRHHIIEAHDEVLAHTSGPESRFGPGWEAGGPGEGAYKIHRGRWQEVCPRLLEQDEVYDAIYFDTFGEDYGQLRAFFTELIPGLLDASGRFGFFNGLGADRQICYDVYTRVAEMHLADAGLDVDWTVVPVDMEEMAEAGKGEWEGVRRRYWTLDEYRLPVCTFLG